MSTLNSPTSWIGMVLPRYYRLIFHLKMSYGYCISKGISFLLIISLISCDSTLTPDEYKRYTTDYSNGLHVQRQVESFVFDLQYQPVDYLKLLNPSSTATDTLQYYLLQIGIAGETDFDILDFEVKNPEERQRRIYYLSYGLQSDVVLQENGKVLPCLLFHFEESFDLKNSRSFLLAFDNPFIDSEESLLIIKSALFGALPVKIKISKDKPLLKKI